jgi:hypothetical protein
MNKNIFIWAFLIVVIVAGGIVCTLHFFPNEKPTVGTYGSDPYPFSSILDRESISDEMNGVPYDDPVQVSTTQNNPAFIDPYYSRTSMVPLAKDEKTVVYEYLSSPCGTLMTQFSRVGSVRVGRGPVYELASQQCKLEKSSYVPNDFSFRVFACENVSNNPSDQGSARLSGKATFAFQCAEPSDETRCSEARINGQTQNPDWNCTGI